MSGVKTIGKVVAIIKDETPGSKGKTTYTYKPYVEFQTDNGNKIGFQSILGDNPSNYKIGDQVRVIYVPDNPKKAKIYSFYEMVQPMFY